MDAPRHTVRRYRALRLSALVLAALVLPACAAPAGEETDAAPTPASGSHGVDADAVPTPASDSHGSDADAAAEVASPALALIIADDEGEVTLLDLETEERSVIAEPRPGIASVASDGRLVYVTHASDDRAAVDVIDAARWTVPHGDHTHSFRGEPHLIGTLEGDGGAQIARGAQRATVQFASGDLVMLAHGDLTDGLDLAPRLNLDPTGPIVPFAERLLVSTAAATLEVYDVDGTPVAGAATPCTSAADADTTRVGAVVTCAEGAVLFTRKVGGVVVGESLPVPTGAPAPTSLAGRSDRPDLAGTAGDQGAWLLDVRQRHWILLSSDVPLLRAAALGDDDSRTIAIDYGGRVRVIAPDGTVLALTEPLLAVSVADPVLRARVQLVVDANHAYVADPATGAVHEVDHDDGAVTRSFTGLDPWFLSQVG